jgi:hypothetical protein
MDNNYPSSFNNNCVKNTSCKTISSSCGNGVSSKFIKSQLNKIKTNETYNKAKVSNSKFENNYSNNLKPLKCSQTTHCLEYKAPKEIINDNIVDFDTTNSHSWSNQRGYGNIVMATNDTCNNIRGKVHPWNRIPKLNNPYSSPADIKMAWDLNN